MRPTRLLDDDDTASMATMIMTSHHAFRRDLGRFASAIAALEPARVEALREEWGKFRGALHGHHEIEDASIFPSTRTEHPDLAAAIDQLASQHHLIDPLLAAGDRAFAALPQTTDAAGVLAELATLLDAHLDLEEATVVPTLRGAKEFPAPENDEMAAMYADGFAWSLDGVAPPVVAKIRDMLPASIGPKLDAARAAFAARCERVWGPRDGSYTSNP